MRGAGGEARAARRRRRRSGVDVRRIERSFVLSVIELSFGLGGQRARWLQRLVAALGECCASCKQLGLRTTTAESFKGPLAPGFSQGHPDRSELTGYALRSTSIYFEHSENGRGAGRCELLEVLDRVLDASYQGRFFLTPHPCAA